MHAVGVGGVVFEDDLDGVADFVVKDGAEDAEVLVFGRARLDCGEGGVGVLVVDGFFVDAADVVGAGFNEAFGDVVEGHAHGFIAAGGSVVPLDLVGGNVVGAGFAGVRGGCGVGGRGVKMGGKGVESGGGEDDSAQAEASEISLGHGSSGALAWGRCVGDRAGAQGSGSTQRFG